MPVQRSNEDQAVRISKSIFVTNFPDNLGSKELWKVCEGYGKVIDVFIPNRRSKAGKRFAFVRFIRVNDLDRLVGNLCTIWIGRFHLHANVARFERANKPVKPSGPSQSNAHGTFGSFVSAARDFPPLIASVAPVSSSPALVLDDSCVVERDLSCHVMGRVKDINSIPNLRILLAKEGFEHVKLSYLGGLWVLIELDNEGSKQKFLDHVGVNSWFCTLLNAYNDFVSDERVVWVDIEGIPLHVWSRETFAKIGNKWGEALDIEDNFGSSFARKRLCILTKQPESILEKFKVIFKGKVFVARAKELFTWNPSFQEPKESVYTSDDESKHGARILNDGAQNSDVESEEECNVDGVSETVFSDNVDECNVDGHDGPANGEHMMNMPRVDAKVMDHSQEVLGHKRKRSGLKDVKLEIAIDLKYIIVYGLKLISFIFIRQKNSLQNDLFSIEKDLEGEIRFLFDEHPSYRMDLNGRLRDIKFWRKGLWLSFRGVLLRALGVSDSSIRKEDLRITLKFDFFYVDELGLGRIEDENSFWAVWILWENKSPGPDGYSFFLRDVRDGACAAAVGLNFLSIMNSGCPLVFQSIGGLVILSEMVRFKVKSSETLLMIVSLRRMFARDGLISLLIMATTSIPHRWKYDVFVSFRGEDIRKSFMDHMFNDFNQKGIYAFRDDDKLPKGEEISPHLYKDIEESRFLIVIFSKNYASSSWCLKELVKILLCKKMGKPKHEVQIIFYDVKPDVLVKIMEGFTLFDSNDRWRWSLEVVPIKVNIHAWKVKLDILPTRLNISKRGMDIESILCPLCEKNVESSSHIFFTCPISREIFRKVLLWWEIDVVMVSSYDEWLEWLLSIRLHSKHK
ncbi:RNA-directed DNA polymerase, eukaryota, nucleotide-binding alpha-beta plait domain protein [Tanacetum coccineum]